VAEVVAAFVLAESPPPLLEAPTPAPAPSPARLASEATRSARALERLLRDAGLSPDEARAVVVGGFAALAATRDDEAQAKPLDSASSTLRSG
jgi:hypothetical protein